MQLTEQDRRLIREFTRQQLLNTIGNAMHASRDGVNAVRQSYRNRKGNNTQTTAANNTKQNNGKPGFFSGTFTAAANTLTNGAYGDLKQMYQRNQVQKAYQKSANDNPNREAYITPYEKKYFDYWAQNVKGSFHIDRYQRSVDSDEAADIAVNMWNSWYAEQTGVNNVKNPLLDKYIWDEVNARHEAKDLSYDAYLKFKKAKEDKSPDAKKAAD